MANEKKKLESAQRAQGRPSKYDTKYDQMLIDHMSEGLSFESFAGVIGMTKDTIYNWLRQYESFADAKKIGTQKSLLFWEKLGRDGIFSISKTERIGSKIETNSRALNSSVYRLNMANRFGWKDRVEQTDSTVEKRLVIKISDDE
jgi:hypothetical protein